MKVTCKHCDRYLFTASGTTIVEQIVCPNTSCKAKLNIKVVNNMSSDADIHWKFKTAETAPKETK